jgi:hypothetical protein
VAVQKAMEDQVQAIFSAKTNPTNAVVAAQKAGHSLLRPMWNRPRSEASNLVNHDVDRAHVRSS